LKSKHNKKRNTALIYEALMRELTKAVVNKNKEMKNTVLTIVKEHFSRNTVMAKELKLYETLCETYDLQPHVAEKMVFEIRKLHEKLDHKKLYTEQSHIIDKINKSLGKSFFSGFLPNYKTLATISQLFNSETSIKKRVLLEETLIQKLASKPGNEDILQPIDNLTFKTFVEKFNTEYTQTLFKEQTALLSKYIASFADNGIDLKVYLNEEISRLKQLVNDSLKTDEISTDKGMVEKTQKVLEMLNNFKNERIGKPLVEKVLKIQSLAREITSDGN